MGGCDSSIDCNTFYVATRATGNDVTLIKVFIEILYLCATGPLSVVPVLIKSMKSSAMYRGILCNLAHV